MDKEKTFDCLCIKSIDYKENDKLITLYAFGEGKLSAALKGVKKSKAKLKYASALFCFGKYTLVGRNGYYNVIGCDLIDSFYGIWTDIDKYYCGVCCLELLDKVADDREIGDRLAVMTLDFLNLICYKINNTQIAFAKYLCEVVKLLGYDLDCACAVCDECEAEQMYYSFLRGGLVCGDCKDSSAMALPTQTVNLLELLFSGSEITAFEQNNEVANVAVRVLFDVIGKNLAKKFKTFDEYVLFYNKN